MVVVLKLGSVGSGFPSVAAPWNFCIVKPSGTESTSQSKFAAKPRFTEEEFRVL